MSRYYERYEFPWWFPPPKLKRKRIRKKWWKRYMSLSRLTVAGPIRGQVITAVFYDDINPPLLVR